MYAEVIVDITNEKLDKIFSYRIPDALTDKVRVGSEVLVPFGSGGRQIKGYVTGLAGKCAYDESRVKDILEVSGGDVGIEAKLVALAAWMKETYGGTMIQAMKTVLPIKKKANAAVKKQVMLSLTEEQAEEMKESLKKKNQKARARVLEALLEQKILPYHYVTAELGLTAQNLRVMEEMGILKVVSEEMYRNPVADTGADTGAEPISDGPELSAEQREAFDRFREEYRNEDYGCYLLFGVTGSGKTEVYMQMIREVIDSGRQAIVLIPEIALTYQTVNRFQRRFPGRVSIMNSRLSAGEKYDQMMRARRGEIDVMIGPRSALFTPFPNLGLIVIDEEHEGAYKSEQVPRYHAREVAVQRALDERASVVLGSATPSMEAYSACEEGRWRLLTLSKRAAGREMAETVVIDMREELKKGNRSILSDHLREQMEDRLEKGQQTMLFLNRRGLAGFLCCRSCGYVVKCPHCDVSLSLHRHGRMMCHYCGHEEEAPGTCPNCGSVHISEFKAGTQQVEDMVKKEFPEARVLRMDLDTTRSRDSYERILGEFAEGKADILIGTQMIVKGHDFPKVTLVGILAADMSLHGGDFRSAERTFQLLAQAAGRAGRGESPGEAVIQTYDSDHYSIRYAAAQDYLSFYEEEMEFRELMGYPPVRHLLAIYASAEEEEPLEVAMHFLGEMAERVVKNTDAAVIGPANPGIGKIKDRYRKVLYIKHDSMNVLEHVKDRLEQYIEMNRGFDRMRIQFDMDPMGSR